VGALGGDQSESLPTRASCLGERAQMHASGRRCRRHHAFDGGIFRVGFFWVRSNTHQCSYVKTKGFIKTKSLPGQTEGLKVGCGGKNKVFIKPLTLGCIGGYHVLNVK
jgi:hypothetical protein